MTVLVLDAHGELIHWKQVARDWANLAANRKQERDALRQQLEAARDARIALEDELERAQASGRAWMVRAVEAGT